MARGLAATPVRQSLNGDDAAAWNYEDEARLWAARGERPWYPTDDEF